MGSRRWTARQQKATAVLKWCAAHRFVTQLLGKELTFVMHGFTPLDGETTESNCCTKMVRRASFCYAVAWDARIGDPAHNKAHNNAHNNCSENLAQPANWARTPSAKR